MSNQYGQSRARLRQHDVDESYYLLLELCCCEPIIRQGFSIIENTCLSHGVTATEAGRKISDEFQAHLNMHWLPFLAASIHASHVYGFVPWRIRRLDDDSGARIPEVLPPGSFRWSVEVPKAEESDAMLRYKVDLNPGQRDEKGVRITEWVKPNFRVNESSIMYATVPSPMAYVIESYKHLQAAIKRQAHADAWNCTARITVSHEPKEFQHDQHRKEIVGAHGVIPEQQDLGGFAGLGGGGGAQRLPFEASQEQVEDAFAGRSMNHVPAVYALPTYRRLEPSPVLQPVMDIAFLQNKYKYDVCSLLGIPADMLMTAVAKLEGNSRSNNRTQGVSRIFQAKMQRVCGFLRELCREVYKAIYEQEAVFSLIPMPRLEVRDVEDLKVLFEIGVVQPEHTLELASILLGNFKKARKRPDSVLGEGAVDDSGTSADKFRPNAAAAKDDEGLKKAKTTGKEDEGGGGKGASAPPRGGSTEKK